MTTNEDGWTLAGHETGSRLLLGTARYPDREVMLDALSASGAEIVTVAVRRVGLNTGQTDLYRVLSEGGFRILPLMEDFDFARRLVKSGKTVCLKDSLLVSARRWEEHGVFRTMAAWFFLQIFFLLGVPAHLLARYYLPIRRQPLASEIFRRNVFEICSGSRSPVKSIFSR